jgi:WD40 repeat protein
MTSGHVIRTLPATVVTNAWFSRDDSRLMFAGGDSPSGAHVTVTTLATGKSVRLETPAVTNCGPPGPAGVFSRDNRLAAAEYFCGTAVVWNTTTGKIVRTIDEGGEASGVDLSPDGKRLLVSSWDSRATIWSVASGKPLVKLIGHTRGIAAAAFTPDGKMAVTTSLDKTARVWDATTGEVLRVLTFPDFQQAIGFSSDSSLLMTVDGEVPPNTPAAVRVFETCPECRDAAALLNLADKGVTPHLTQLERTVVGRD